MLSDIKIRKALPREKVYRLSDGRGLSIEIKPNGSKLWRFRYAFAGVAKMISLGVYPEVGLSEARDKLHEVRKLVSAGDDPSVVRRVERKGLEHSFEDAAKDWFAIREKDYGERNAKELWGRIEKDLLPQLGSRPIGKIQAYEVLGVLRRVEARGAVESAHRLLGWSRQIFRHAVACGVIASDPTRDLRGALVRPEERHYPAILDHAKIGAYVRSVRSYFGGVVVRAALEFGLLTFVRPGNLRAAEWAEMRLDGESPRWVIPAEKMKMKGRADFVVPLAPQAVKILADLRVFTGKGRYCFPNPRHGDRPMSNAAVNAAIRSMGYTSEEMTGHGVRAMARTICHEVLQFAPEVIEEQLAHGKAGPLGGAYDRTTHMSERVRLMREWAGWLDVQATKKPTE
jgi:integrase